MRRIAVSERSLATNTSGTIEMAGFSVVAKVDLRGRFSGISMASSLNRVEDTQSTY
jgi:hypothetical protein